MGRTSRKDEARIGARLGETRAPQLDFRDCETRQPFRFRITQAVINRVRG